MTDYFERPEMPGQKFFRCEQMFASLTVSACAGMWRKENHERNKSHPKCMRCPIGAVHAGEGDANLSPVRGTNPCARCGMPATRLVSKHLCVSCQNREYEWIKGANAKGRPPVKMRPLAPRCLQYMDGRQPCTIKRHLTVGVSELMLAAARDARRSVTIHCQARPIGARQGRLFR